MATVDVQNEDKLVTSVQWLLFYESHRAEAVTRTNALARRFLGALFAGRDGVRRPRCLASQNVRAVRQLVRQLPADSLPLVRRIWADAEAAERAVKEHLCVVAYLASALRCAPGRREGLRRSVGFRMRTRPSPTGSTTSTAGGPRRLRRRVMRRRCLSSSGRRASTARSSASWNWRAGGPPWSSARRCGRAQASTVNTWLRACSAGGHGAAGRARLPRRRLDA